MRRKCCIVGSSTCQSRIGPASGAEKATGSVAPTSTFDVEFKDRNVSAFLEPYVGVIL